MWMNPYSTIKPSTHVNLTTHYTWNFFMLLKGFFFFFPTPSTFGFCLFRGGFDWEFDNSKISLGSMDLRGISRMTSNVTKLEPKFYKLGAFF